MSILAEVFTAESDEQALRYDDQPDTFNDKELFTGFTVIELSTLRAILRGEEWNADNLGQFPEIMMQENGEASIFRLPHEMVDGLAKLGSSDSAAAAARWAATEELHCSAADVQPIIEALTRLAKAANANRQKVYLWNCL
jgi:hypothetical protein